MTDGHAEFVLAERILRVASSLGANVLPAERRVLTEGVSWLFEGRLWVRSKTPEIAPAELPGRPVGLSSELGEGPRRAWNAVVARLRMQADEAEHVRVEGASMVRTLAAGHRFTPYDVANPDNVFAPHVVTSVTHEVVDTSYESVANQPDYANRFAALPADVPATPRRATPRPRIDGVQVAIVAGPPGEEIHPDAHGR